MAAPEFGTIAILILVVSLIGVSAIGRRYGTFFYHYWKCDFSKISRAAEYRNIHRV